MLQGLDAVERDLGVVDALITDGMDEPLFAEAVARLEQLAETDEEWLKTADAPVAIKDAYKSAIHAYVGFSRLMAKDLDARTTWQQILLPLDLEAAAEARKAILAIAPVSS